MSDLRSHQSPTTRATAAPRSIQRAQKRLKELIAHDKSLMTVLKKDVEFKQCLYDEVDAQVVAESNAAEGAKQRSSEAKQLREISVEFLARLSPSSSETIPAGNLASSPQTSHNPNFPPSQMSQELIRGIEKTILDTTKALQDFTKAQSAHCQNASLAKLLVDCLRGGIQDSKTRIDQISQSLQKQSDFLNCLDIFQANLLRKENAPSSLSAIQRVNKDIWTIIFTFLVSHEEQCPGPSDSRTFSFRDDPNYSHPEFKPLPMTRNALRLSLVCSKWRQILQSTLSLWTTVPIDWTQDHTRQLEYLKHHASFAGSADLALVISSPEGFMQRDITSYVSTIPNPAAVKTLKFTSVSNWSMDISPWLRPFKEVEHLIGISNAPCALYLSDVPTSLRYVDVPDIRIRNVTGGWQLESLSTGLLPFYYSNATMKSLRRLHITHSYWMSPYKDGDRQNWIKFWEHNSDGDTIDELVLSPSSKTTAESLVYFINTFKKVTKLEMRGPHSVHILSALEEDAHDCILHPEKVPRFSLLQHLIIRDYKPPDVVMNTFVASCLRLSSMQTLTTRLEDVLIQAERGTPGKLFEVEDGGDILWT